MCIRYAVVTMMISIAIIIAQRGLCETADKWEWEAGRIYFADKGINDCIKRCQILSDEMRAEGVVHYIVSGFYCKRHHRWIERNGKILDPSQLISTPDMYEAVTRIRIGDNDYPPGAACQYVSPYSVGFYGNDYPPGAACQYTSPYMDKIPGVTLNGSE